MAFEQRSEGRKGRAKQIPGERAEETERAKSVRKEWSWRFLRKSKEVSVPGPEQTRGGVIEERVGQIVERPWQATGKPLTFTPSETGSNILVTNKIRGIE